MVENQFSPYSDFHSSPYDPKWWLDPPSYDCSNESQDNFCDLSPQFPTSQVDDDSASTNDACEFSQNWYVDDLLDQVYSLQKLPSQSVKNYISEAKSLAYALTRAGEPIDEIELIDCIIDGLDDSLSDFCKYYYEINPSLSLDLLSHMLLDHEKLQDIPSLSPRCDISHAHSPPTGYSDEHLSASAQSRQSVYQSRQADPSASEVKVDVIRHPDPSAFPQFSPVAYPFSLATSPPSGTKSNIALVSSISMQSARLATDGSLMHFLLYGSHVPTSAAFSSKFGQSRSATMDTSDIMLSQSKTTCPPPIQHMPPTFLWLDVIIMHATSLFNLSWKLSVFSLIRGVVILLTLHLHGCSTKCKLKLRFPTFRLWGRIRRYFRNIIF